LTWKHGLSNVFRCRRSSEEDRATAPNNAHRKFRKVWMFVLR